MKISTKESSAETINTTIGRDNLSNEFKTYFINPLTSGIMGFAVFFSLIFFTKLFSYLFGISDIIGFGINDLILSLTGFVFAAGAKFLEFFGKED